MPFHFEMADFPASRPSRKPSSVSAIGVLTDIPVTMMRSGFDKVDLHNGEGADRIAAHNLSGAHPGIFVAFDDLRQDCQVVPRLDLGQEYRVMNLKDTNLARAGPLTARRPIGRHAEQA